MRRSCRYKLCYKIPFGLPDLSQKPWTAKMTRDYFFMILMSRSLIKR